MAEARVICTIGPRSATPEVWHSLINAGATGFRIPFAKEDPDTQFTRAASMSREFGSSIDIFADLPGTAPRTLNNRPYEIGGRKSISLVPETDTDDDTIPISMWTTVNKHLEPGMHVVFGDGEVAGSVTGVSAASITIQPEHVDGPLRQRRRIAWQGWERVASPMGDFERLVVADSRMEFVTGIMWSFVSSPAQLEEISNRFPHLRSKESCAKVEGDDAVECLDAIANAADSLLLGQGDLLVSSGDRKFVQHIQTVASFANSRPEYPIIVGTGLLDNYASGILSRAELGYLALLIQSRITGFMLAGETTIGDNAVECVRLLNDLLQASR